MKRDVLARQAQKELTRARLVEAALAVFAERGYQEATVDDISAAAGHSKGAFYFHYGSKEDVFLELLKLWVEEQTARLETFERSAPAAALLDGLEGFLSYERRERNWPPLVLEFWAQGRRDAGLQSALQQAYASWQRLLAQAFHRAARNGVLVTAVAPEVAARTVLAAHDGLVVEACLDPEAAAQGSLRRVLGALLSYLATGSPAAMVDVSRPLAAETEPRRRGRRPSAA